MIEMSGFNLPEIGLENQRSHWLRGGFRYPFLPVVKTTVRHGVKISYKLFLKGICLNLALVFRR